MAGRHTGRTDIPLTDEGRRVAEALRAPLATFALARVVTSPLARAVETCRLAGLGDRAEHDERLVERDYGECEGRTTAEIREERPGWSAWHDDCPGAESLEDMGRRADGVIADLREAEGDVAVFAHGHMLRVLAARWIDLPPDRGRSFPLSTAAICVLGWEREEPALRLWNYAGALS